MRKQNEEDLKKIEFMKFRYANLLSEADKQQEGIIYAGDFQFLMEYIDVISKKVN